MVRRLRNHLPRNMPLTIPHALFFLSPSKVVSSLLMSSLLNTTYAEHLKYLETSSELLCVHFCSYIGFYLTCGQWDYEQVRHFWVRPLRISNTTWPPDMNPKMSHIGLLRSHQNHAAVDSVRPFSACWALQRNWLLLELLQAPWSELLASLSISVFPPRTALL